MERLHIDPSTLYFERPQVRRLIIASYWLVILLAVPLWWKTTSIDRLSLPASRVHAEQQRKVSFPVTINLESDDNLPPTSLERVVQSWLQTNGSFTNDDALDVRLTLGDKSSAMYNVILRQGKSESSIQGRELFLSVDAEADFGPQDASMKKISNTLANLLAPYSTYYRSDTQVQRVFKYSPRYRLAFSLLNEDATSGSGAMAWDVHRAIQKHISPLLNKLSVLHNFTIESQVQFHAPLAFEPRSAEHEGGRVHGLTHEDLTVFVNSAEWTLSSSVSNDPVIHFVLFVPSASHNPLRILSEDSSIDPSTAFLLPQWGGVVVLNPSEPSPRLSQSHLEPVFKTFAVQLLTLLGVPGLPLGITSLPPADGTPEPFTDWELDALLRRRAAENVRDSSETLSSIVRLVDQIENMPVGQDVRGDVQDALSALNEVHASAPTSQLAALQSSARALTHASRAFFNPGMLALLYFPAEHTYAVYTPLFASVAAPLVGAVLREFSAWRKGRRAAAAAQRAS